MGLGLVCPDWMLHRSMLANIIASHSSLKLLWDCLRYYLMASDTTDYSNAANFHKVRAAVLHIRHTIWNIWNHNSTDVRFLASLDGHVHFMCTLCALYDQCNAGFVAKKNENPRCYGWRVGDLGGQNDDCHHQSAARQRGAQYPLEDIGRISLKNPQEISRIMMYYDVLRRYYVVCVWFHHESWCLQGTVRDADATCLGFCKEKSDHTLPKILWASLALKLLGFGYVWMETLQIIKRLLHVIAKADPCRSQMFEKGEWKPVQFWPIRWGLAWLDQHEVWRMDSQPEMTQLFQECQGKSRECP